MKKANSPSPSFAIFWLFERADVFDVPRRPSHRAFKLKVIPTEAKLLRNESLNGITFKFLIPNLNCIPSFSDDSRERA